MYGWKLILIRFTAMQICILRVGQPEWTEMRSDSGSLLPMGGEVKLVRDRYPLVPGDRKWVLPVKEPQKWDAEHPVCMLWRLRCGGMER